MEIGILGPRQSGKTTIFNALTGSDIPVAAFSSGKPEPHIAVVNIPDERAEKLIELYHPKKTVYAQVRFLDLPGIEKPAGQEKQGLPEEQIRTLQNADALLIVLRNFTDSSGIKPSPFEDLELIQMELIFSDLAKVENRLPGLEKSLLKVQGQEKDRLHLEHSTLVKIKPILEAGRFIAEQKLTPDEEKSIRGFQFLTQKPILFLLNCNEETFHQSDELIQKLKEKLISPNAAIDKLFGQIEMEILSLDPESRLEFLKDYNIKEPAAKKIIRLCYDILGVISFFTAGPPEVHVWTIPAGTIAPKAAGTIHSDFEKGFIRAEVIPWDKLIEYKGFAEAKKHALVRTEGKSYIIQDGDVIEILFN